MIINKRKGESYQHAAAKAVFKGWLDEANKISEFGVEFGPFKWRGNIFEEFPFIKGISEPNNIDQIERCPTYEELITYGVKPIAIADIAISHKGMIVYAIEIVHKHDLDQNKISRMLAMKSFYELEIWRVEAHWILSQIDIPNEFPEACIRRIKFAK